MGGIDYIGNEGLEAAGLRWLEALAPYRRAGRPVGSPERSALLVLDLQHFFCDVSSHAYLPVSRRIAPGVLALVEGFRLGGSPVIFTRHALAPGDEPGRMGDWWSDVVVEDSTASQLAPWVPASPDDSVIRKTRYDAFAQTDLESCLARSGVDTVVIAGVMTHLCCESTARSAFHRGYRVAVAADATASVDESLHLGALRSLAHGFASVLPVSRILQWRRGEPMDRSPGEPTLVTTDVVDVAVVGAGPAGLAAAVQARRQGLSAVLMESDRVGGLLRQANRVENYLGAGVRTGPDLVEAIAQHASRLGIEPQMGTVREVEIRTDGLLQVDVEGHRLLVARNVILATGSRPRTAGFAGERDLAGELLHYGVAELFHDAAAPGPVAVVGGGDAAYDQAISLAERGWAVSLLQRGPRPRALQRLVQRASSLGVAVHAATSVVDAARSAHGVDVRWRAGERRGTLAVDRVLVAVGREPHVPRVMDRRHAVPRCIGEVAALDAIPGLYPIGDLARGRFRQVSMAVGDGVEAAMRVASRLDSEDNR